MVSKPSQVSVGSIRVQGQLEKLVSLCSSRNVCLGVLMSLTSRQLDLSQSLDHLVLVFQVEPGTVIPPLLTKGTSRPEELGGGWCAESSQHLTVVVGEASSHQCPPLSPLSLRQMLIRRSGQFFLVTQLRGTFRCSLVMLCLGTVDLTARTEEGQDIVLSVISTQHVDVEQCHPTSLGQGHGIIGALS